MRPAGSDAKNTGAGKTYAAQRSSLRTDVDAKIAEIQDPDVPAKMLGGHRDAGMGKMPVVG
jgi:hypothetical protein